MNIRNLIRLLRVATPVKPANFMSTTARTQRQIAQGIKGSAHLFTGNFSYFTKYERAAIKSALTKGNVYVMVYDRDSIAVPANERAMWIREHFNHHPNLEVRVAYGAPSESVADKKKMVAYLKKQIPPHINLMSIWDNRAHYSEDLAQELNVPVLPHSHSIDIHTLEELIRRNPDSHRHLMLPEVARRVISPFNEVLDADAFKALYKAEIPIVKQNIIEKNPAHPNQDYFFKRARWNIDNVGYVNLPIIVSRITDPEQQASFSARTNTQVFDMPVYMPSQGWKIPAELAPYQKTLATIVAAESLSNNAIVDCNVYITVDCGVVPPHGYARREGLHVDGFLSQANARRSKDGVVWGDNTYVVSDAPELQTEFYPGPFNLSGVNKGNPQAVLQAFEEQGKDMPYVQCKPYDIARLTTNNVHAVHPNMTERYLQRCFLKVTFSERLFNRTGNTINPNLNYRFIYVPRSSGRNTQNYIGNAPVGFDEVDLREINFTAAIFPSWVVPKLLTVCKNPKALVIATPANEGDVLETSVNDQVVTVNVARAGDTKVSRTKKDSYFLGSDFLKLYRPTSEPHVYAPTDRTLKALKVSKNVTFTAPWGTRQNIPAGGYIVEDTSGETWGVHQESFAATYLEERPTLRK